MGQIAPVLPGPCTPRVYLQSAAKSLVTPTVLDQSAPSNKGHHHALYSWVGTKIKILID